MAALVELSRFGRLKPMSRPPCSVAAAAMSRSPVLPLKAMKPKDRFSRPYREFTLDTVLAQPAAHGSVAGHQSEQAQQAARIFRPDLDSDFAVEALARIEDEAARLQLAPSTDAISGVLRSSPMAPGGEIDRHILGLHAIEPQQSGLHRQADRPLLWTAATWR
jgi:hypothetical protein